MPDRIDAPGAQRRVDIGEPGASGPRDADLPVRSIDEARVRGPDLDHEVEPFLREGFGELAWAVVAIAKGEGELAQLVVEELGGLLARLVEDNDSRDEAAEKHDPERPDQQAPAQRVHAAHGPAERV